MSKEGQYPNEHANKFKWFIYGLNSGIVYTKMTEKGLAGVHSSMEWALRKGATRVVIMRGEKNKAQVDDGV
jgi:hypothetical protein